MLRMNRTKFVGKQVAQKVAQKVIQKVKQPLPKPVINQVIPSYPSNDSAAEYTIPMLLAAAIDRHPNATALNQWSGNGWQSIANQNFQQQSEAIAQGLLQLNLQTGDRVALLLHSDANFAMVDMGCLMAHLVNVPIDLTQTIENIIFMMRHSESQVLFVANLDFLRQIAPYLVEAPDLQTIVVVEVPANWSVVRLQWTLFPTNDATENITENSEVISPIPEQACLNLPTFLQAVPAPGTATVQPIAPLPDLPTCMALFSLEEFAGQAQIAQSSSSTQQQPSNRTISPDDRATIIYIPSPSGQLLGVTLTHRNLAANALAAFAGLPDLAWGDQEVILSFLPLTHVFARCLLYGHIYYGHSIYFSHPNRVAKHLQSVHPTIVATVPLLLEKIYNRIVEQGQQTRSSWQRFLFTWAFNQAQRYKLGQRSNHSGLYALHLGLANRLVLSRWRSIFGHRLKYILCGGAALKPELANVFAAAQVQILQGYGLTQAGIVCFNRHLLNQAGTVGHPIAGVEISIAADQEILIRSPYVTPGYYQDAAATQTAIDAEGWLHTGDLGQLNADGVLQITGLKKALFKLSSGKYIAPQPIETRLRASPFVEQAIVVGADRKFCSALIFPHLSALRDYARHWEQNLPDSSSDPSSSDPSSSDPSFSKPAAPDAALLQHPCTFALYESIVEAANCHLPYWSAIKRFQLIDRSSLDEAFRLAQLTPEAIDLTQPLDRKIITQIFAPTIETLYANQNKSQNKSQNKIYSKQDTAVRTNTTHAAESKTFPLTCPIPPLPPCPISAQSLDLRT